MLRKYTVVGLYTDTNLNYVGHMEKESIKDAVRAACELDEALSVLAVFDGHCENQLDSEYAVDQSDLS